MLKRIIFGLCLALSLPTQAQISAKLDQTTIYQGEKIVLTLESDQVVEIRPDLRSLQQQFAVLGTKRVLISSYTTGAVVTRTRWEIQLRPLSDGEQVIPQLTLGNELSPELPLSVLPADRNPNPGQNATRPVYLEVELDKASVYVDAQAIIRAKLFHIPALSEDAHLTLPESEDALIKPLEEQKQYSTLIRGQRYNVTENSFTVFPNREGIIEISPLFFTASQMTSSTLELESPSLQLTAIPRLPSAGALWLPAIDMYIEDVITDSATVEVGKPVNRIITLEATGQPASALPSMAVLENSNAKIELINVVLEEQMTEEGIISRRQEELRITPSAAGVVALEAIEIPWWNTRSDRGQSVSLDTRTLHVKAAPGTSVFSSASATGDESSDNTRLLIWLLTFIILATTLGCIYAINRLRSQKQAEIPTLDESMNIDHQLQAQFELEAAEQDAFDALHIACHQNTPEIAQLNLIEWAQLFWRDDQLNSMEQLCAYADNQTINFLILDLEQHLYSDTPELWQGDLLIDAISKLRKRQTRQTLDLTSGDRLAYSYTDEMRRQ